MILTTRSAEFFLPDVTWRHS